MKSRVWDKVQRKMFYSGYYITPGGEVLWRNDAKPKPDEYVLMFSVGFKDLNDKDVYGGDWIYGEIEYDLGGSAEQENIEIDSFEGVIMWTSTGFDVDTKGDGKPEVNLAALEEHCEVMGNIYENPELRPK